MQWFVFQYYYINAYTSNKYIREDNEFPYVSPIIVVLFGICFSENLTNKTTINKLYLLISRGTIYLFSSVFIPFHFILKYLLFFSTNPIFFYLCGCSSCNFPAVLHVGLSLQLLQCWCQKRYRQQSFPISLALLYNKEKFAVVLLQSPSLCPSLVQLKLHLQQLTCTDPSQRCNNPNLTIPSHCQIQS